MEYGFLQELGSQGSVSMCHFTYIYSYEKQFLILGRMALKYMWQEALDSYYSSGNNG